MSKLISGFFAMLIACGMLPTIASANDNGPCPRPAAGSRPLNRRTSTAVTACFVSFNYYTTVDTVGRTLFCFETSDGLESPTLHLRPGDTLNLLVTNLNPKPPPGSPTEVVSNTSDACGDVTMTITSLNVHFHGTNTSPTCHADEVIHTLINSGEPFNYSVQFPTSTAAQRIRRIARC